MEFCLPKLKKYYQKLRYITKNYNGISDLGLTLPHFEFLSLYLFMVDQIFIFCAQNINFDQTYLFRGLETQNVEELSLNMIFHDIFW